ncbi:MAG: ribbon-helix-helix domain-containing protein [Nanoarchaeota archaeon]|nr:ribbon-helix-helix domain-containing protein [Nanoarchaeota archaeon]
MVLLKKKISITVSKPTVLELFRFLAATSHRSKSEAIETAVRRLLDES